MPASFSRVGAIAAVFAWSTVLTSACGEDPVGAMLTDGVLATFVVEGDTFKVWITDEQARTDVIAVLNGNSNRTIPDGQINLGPGIVQYNAPWSWHLDAEEIQMVDQADAVCDGTPSEVQANLSEWIDDPGRFCPSGAELIFLESL